MEINKLSRELQKASLTSGIIPTVIKTRESSPLKRTHVEIEDESPAIKVKTVLDPVTKQLSLVGEYRILEKLGSGGFGTTFKGEKYGEYYAIKKLKEEKYAIQEINMLQKISDFCASYFSCLNEILVDEKGSYYIVSDYIPGPSSKDLFASFTTISEVEYYTFKLFKELSEAIELLHENGIVHRDIKPENIIYNTRDKVFHLIDFGIAFDLDEPTARRKSRSLAGTTEYESPRYIKYWSDGKDTDEWRDILLYNDVYGIAITIYRLVEKRFPYLFTDRNNKLSYYVIKPIPYRSITSFMIRDQINLILLNNDPPSAEILSKIFNFSIEY